MPVRQRRAEIKNLRVCRVSEDSRTEELDSVIHEAEVVIRLDGRAYRRLFCLPTHLEELALGHLLSQGIVASPDVKIEPRKNDIWIYSERKSGTIKKPQKITSQLRIAQDQVFDSVKRLDENSILYQKTGGTHVVGILSAAHQIFVEDISRHCAVDKVIGLALKKGIDLSQSVLVTSCRQTLSTIRKAIYAQIPIVISVSAATDLAIENANLFGITLVGFARGRHFNIYCHDWRILSTPG
ncbi:Sulfur carrier protein FdhD [subsurface metagenome]